MVPEALSEKGNGRQQYTGQGGSQMEGTANVQTQRLISFGVKVSTRRPVSLQCSELWQGSMQTISGLFMAAFSPSEKLAWPGQWWWRQEEMVSF